MARMLAALEPWVEEALIVVGFEADLVHAAAEAACPRPPLRFVTNPRYLEGSVLSMEAGLSAPRKGAQGLLLMDADVLFPEELLKRLLEGPPDCFLLDPRSEASGEEMMLVAREGRVHRLARAVEPEPGDRVGEGVGFLKVSPRLHGLLFSEVRRFAQGRPQADYENAIDAILGQVEIGYVEVSDLPWTEVDFEEDLVHAREVVLPQIRILEAVEPVPSGSGEGADPGS